MDCLTCRTLLGDGTAGAGRAVREHLRGCPACRDLERLLGQGLSFPSVEVPEGLVDDVLRRTSGSACAQAAEMACELVDDNLTGIDLELMHLHLGDCPDCARLVSTLVYLSENLPSMARVDPGRAFTREVLAMTPSRSLEPRPRWAELWGAVWRRPRFALELAYLTAVTLWIAFSLAGSPLDEQVVRMARAPGVQRLVKAPEAVPRVVAGAASLGEVAWETAEQRSARTLRIVQTDLSRRANRSRGARQALHRNGAELRRAAVNLDLKSGYSALSRVPGDLADLVKQFAASPSDAPDALDRS